MLLESLPVQMKQCEGVTSRKQSPLLRERDTGSTNRTCTCLHPGWTETCTGNNTYITLAWNSEDLMEFPNMKTWEINCASAPNANNGIWQCILPFTGFGSESFFINNCIQQECIKEEYLMNIRYTIIPLTWMSISLLYGTVGLLTFPEEETSAGEQFEFFIAWIIKIKN